MKTQIIAEAGVDHGESLEEAKYLTLAAQDAGADAVKICNFRSGRVVSVDAPNASYQLKSTDPSESWFGDTSEAGVPRRLFSRSAVSEEVAMS